MNAAQNKHQEPPNFIAGLHTFEPDVFGTTEDLQLYPKHTPQDTAEMQEILARIRMQLRYIIHSVRCWKDRDSGLTHPLRRRYSAYEGAMCVADLRRHWAYYRYAMADYAALKRT